MKKILRNFKWKLDIDGLMQERRNSIANALELRISCTNSLISFQKEEHL